ELQVHEDHVGLTGRTNLKGLLTGGRLPHHLHVLLGGDQAGDAATHQFVVVHETEPELLVHGSLPLTLATPLSQTQMARFEGGSSPRARTNVPAPGPGRPFPGTNWQPRRPSARPALPPGAGGSALGRPDLIDA